MHRSTNELLASLDPLSHRARTTALVAWARTAADRAEVCADLRTAGPYERRLALTASAVAGDAAGVDAALADPQLSIRAAAWPVALRAGRLPATDLDLASAERRGIYRSLRQLHRPAIADALLPRVRELYGDDEAAALLPACGADVVRALLPELDHAVNLTGLARRYPEVLLDHVTVLLAAADAVDRERIWDRAGPAVLRCDPARVLDLLERHLPRSIPGDLTRYGVLAAHDPARVARLLADPRWAAVIGRHGVPRAVRRRLAVLPVAELVPLARRLRDTPWAWARLLGALAPGRRGELFDAALADVDTSAALPAPEVMEVLPAGIRVAEATRVLGLGPVRAHEADVWTWSAYLPWAQAWPAVTGGLRQGNAAERGRAYELLIDAARLSRDPDVVADLITRLHRLGNEQDPVRSAALTALARVARLLTAASAPGLTRLTTDAVQARDASGATLAALSRLAVEVLRLHVASLELTDWALLTVDLVASGRTVPVLGRFDRTLRRGQEVMVYERLRPWIEGAAARGRFEPLFAVTRSLGRRAARVPDLQAALGRAIDPGNVPDVVRTAIVLWLADPRTRADRVGAVLAADASAVSVPEVWEALCRSRTDLLDVVLERAPRGRFVKKGVRWVPPGASQAGHWLPRQHAAFVAVHERRIADPGSSPWQRAASIAAIARVPGIGADAVRRHLGDGDVVPLEAALGALAWTDRPDEALSALLAHAGDDRARVAMYAAGRAAGHTAPSRLPALLGGVLFGAAKVTSRKEAARLLAKYGPPQSMQALLEAYSAEGRHRDVRAAIAGAARGRLWELASWAILDAAVHGSREESRAVLGARPEAVAGHHRTRYAGLVAAACRGADREVARDAYEALPAWSPWAGDVTGLIVDRLTDLADGEEPVGAAELIGALPAGRPGLATALRRLVDADVADDDEGGPVRDRVARRRIDLLAGATAEWAARAPLDVDRAPAVEAARALAGEPSFAGAGLTMLVGLGRLDNLDEVADRCADRPVLAVRTATAVSGRLRDLRVRADPEAIRATADRLGGRGDLAGGLFAVALAVHGARYGWAVPWRDLVRELRRHPDGEVRAEAYRVEMA